MMATATNKKKAKTYGPLKRDGTPRAKKHRMTGPRSLDAFPGMGKRIRQARTELGLSVRELAALCECHHNKIVGAENERGYGGLALPTFARLCIATGYCPEWFFGWTNDRRRRTTV